jgi:hypothetical protein
MSHMIPQNIGMYSGNASKTESLQLACMTDKGKGTPTQSFKIKALFIYMIKNRDV